MDFGTYWLGSYNQFDVQGTYIITIYAQDTEGVLSLPAQTVVVKQPVAADIDGDNDVDLADGITSLQALCGMFDNVRPHYSQSCADVNENNQIGLEEVINILQQASGARE